MKYRILIEQDEDNMFVAEVPSLPGCVSQGKTRAEAIDNAKDAIHGHIESLKKHGVIRVTDKEKLSPQS